MLSFALLFAGCAPSRPTDVPNAHVVEKGVLIRSGQPTAVGLAELRDKYGVQTVINLNDATTDEELVTAMSLGLDYVALPLWPYGLDRDKLVTFLAVIRQAEQDGRVPVLVHCRHGQDRTGAAAATYRVVEQGWSGDRAARELLRYQAWTHEIAFPHLDDVPREVEAKLAEWQEAVEERGDVPIIRPPVPWNPTKSTTQPGGMPPDNPARASSRPSPLDI